MIGVCPEMNKYKPRTLDVGGSNMVRFGFMKSTLAEMECRFGFGGEGFCGRGPPEWLWETVGRLLQRTSW